MIFTSLSLTSFQKHGLQEKSIQNASLAADVCSARIPTFPQHVSPHSPTEGSDRAPHQQLGGSYYGGCLGTTSACRPNAQLSCQRR